MAIPNFNNYNNNNYYYYYQRFHGDALYKSTFSLTFTLHYTRKTDKTNKTRITANHIPRSNLATLS